MLCLVEALEPAAAAAAKFTSGSAAVQLHQLTPLRAPLAAPRCSFPAAWGAPRLSPPLARAKAPRSGSCQGMETHTGVWGVDVEKGLHPEDP